MAWNVFKKKEDEKSTAPQSASAGKSATVTPVSRKEDQAPARKKAGNYPVAAHAIFVRPLVTEKSLGLTRHDVYAFEVVLHATKIDIKKAFANLYGVMPTGVRVARQQGKVVRFGRREGRRRDSKKAFITVPKGTTIDI